MRALLILLTLVLVCARAWGQGYPTKPIRLVVGFAPGGAADAASRAIGEPLGRILGQSIIVDNRPGNGSSLAAEIVAKAPADGYTMLIASPSSQSVNPVINKNLGYVPGRDFTGAAAARTQAVDGQGRHRRGGLEVAGGVRSLHAREREALAAARERYRG